MHALWQSVLEPYRIPIQEAELLGFESDIGFRLPNTYRQFLLGVNGGSVFVDHELSQESRLVLLFPFTRPPSDGLCVVGERDRQYEYLHLRKCFLQIGVGSIGDHFYIDLRNASQCPVFNIYKDDVLRCDTYKAWSDLSVRIETVPFIHVADDFDELPALILGNRC